MKIFDTAFGIHGKALNLRAQRMEVISKNIANADTPGFKARDIDFKNVLNNVERAGTMRTTHSKHIGQAASAGLAEAHEPLGITVLGPQGVVGLLRLRAGAVGAAGIAAAAASAAA